MWDKIQEVFNQLQLEMGIQYSCGHSTRLPHFMCSVNFQKHKDVCINNTNYIISNYSFYFTITDDYVEHHTIKEIHDRIVKMMYQEICVK